MKENKADDWVKLFQLKGASVPGTPYDARMEQSRPADPQCLEDHRAVWYGNRVTCERNPYYWKVDTAGNQLPYIDKVTYDVAARPAGAGVEGGERRD